MDYIRQSYSLTVKKGDTVTLPSGNAAKVVGARGQYLRVRLLDTYRRKRPLILSFHPHDLKFGEGA